MLQKHSDGGFDDAAPIPGGGNVHQFHARAWASGPNDEDEDDEQPMVETTSARAHHVLAQAIMTPEWLARVCRVNAIWVGDAIVEEGPANGPSGAGQGAGIIE